MSKIRVLNGPNLNLIGSDEPAVSRATTLAVVERAIEASAVGRQ